MPCFSTGPMPGTPEYDSWIPEVQIIFASFAHVVDYYYRKADLPMPQPGTVEHLRKWFGGLEIPTDAIQPVDAERNERVLRQILLHLDCDGVDVFRLNEIQNFLVIERTPQKLGYGLVLGYCFAAMRNHAV